MPKRPARPLVTGAPEGALVAANDNRPGNRRVLVRNFEAVPICLDEVAVIDRLMQELVTAANDNHPIDVVDNR